MTNMRRWRTRDGREIRIKDMDDNHLRNTIAFIERNHEAQIESAENIAYSMQGEMAILTMDRQIDMMRQEGPDTTSGGIYTHMVGEKERRERKTHG